MALSGKGTSGESSRHSRYAVSGLLCPNFCAHLSAHPFANPGIPRLGRPTLLLASLVTGFHFWSQQASDEPFSIFSLFISSTLYLPFSFYRYLCFRLSYLVHGLSSAAKRLCFCWLPRSVLSPIAISTSSPLSSTSFSAWCCQDVVRNLLLDAFWIFFS